MAISYQGAFDKMQEKGVTTYRIRKENILSQSTLQKMRDGKYVTTETIERLCLLLDCTPNDLMTAWRRRSWENKKHKPPTHTAPGAFRRLPSRVFNIFRC